MRKIIIILFFLTACTQELNFTAWDNGLPKTGEWRTTLALGDVNKDGFLDIGSMGRKGKSYASVWLNEGNGSWQLSIDGIPQTMQCGVGVDFNDANNDGNLDVAFGQHCGGAAVYLGDGRGAWKNYSTGLTTENVNPIAFADFDKDGLPDVITLGAFTEGFTIYKNTGSEWQKIKTTLPTEIDATAYQILTPDINDDGLPDIISTGGQINVFLNKGNFTFNEYNNGLDVKAFFTYLAVGDINKDGKLDLAASGHQQLLLYTQQENNWELRYNRTSSCESGGGIAIADINNDKQLDLIASCTDGIQIFLGPELTPVQNNLPLIDSIPHGLYVADMNNDGKKDIIAAFGKETNLGKEGIGGIYVWVQTEIFK